MSAELNGEEILLVSKPVTPAMNDERGDTDISGPMRAWLDPGAARPVHWTADAEEEEDEDFDEEDVEEYEEDEEFFDDDDEEFDEDEDDDEGE